MRRSFAAAAFQLTIGLAVTPVNAEMALPSKKLVASFDELDIVMSKDQGDSPNANMNGLIVICPESPLANKGDAPLALLFRNNVARDVEALTGIEKSVTEEPEIKTMRLPKVNIAFIDRHNNVLPAYTFGEIAEGLEKRIADPSLAKGSSPHNSVLHQNIRKHVQNFCFAAF